VYNLTKLIGSFVVVIVYIKHFIKRPYITGTLMALPNLATCLIIGRPCNVGSNQLGKIQGTMTLYKHIIQQSFHS